MPAVVDFINIFYNKLLELKYYNVIMSTDFLVKASFCTPLDVH